MPKVGDGPFIPFWQTTDHVTVRMYCGDVLRTLRRMPAKSVHMVCTSPPYWGLRSYLGDGHDDKHLELGSEKLPFCRGYEFGPNCAAIDWANGCFVCRLVLVFREVRRVLRDDGVCWLNLGDSYNANTGLGFNGNANRPPEARETRIKGDTGVKAGNLVGVPWRTALALQADGWILRSDLPWVKRSAMPESCTNRPAKALEYVFQLVKKSGYYFDMEAIKPKSKGGWCGADFLPDSDKDLQESSKRTAATGANRSNGSTDDVGETGRNFRNADLWFQSIAVPHGLVGVEDELVGLDVTSQGYPGAHFATFPVGLVTPLLLAGSSAHGCCADCGAPWKRVTARTALKRERPNDYVKRTGEEGTGNSCGNTVAGVSVETLGWQPTCTCHGTFVKRLEVVPKSTARVTGGDRNQDGDAGASPRDEGDKEQIVTEYISDILPEDHPVKPCVILDPFLGAATTAIVALEHGRYCVGIELSSTYLRFNAVPRVEGKLLGIPANRHLVPRKAEASVTIFKPPQLPARKL